MLATFVALLAGLSAVARAQTADSVLPDPCATANATSPGSCDSEITPQTRDGAEMGWDRIAGAAFGASEAENSPTPVSVDFFASDFRTKTEGFFAGAQCADPDAGFDELEGCERAPAIYRYSVPPGLDPVIEPVYGPDFDAGQDEPGYVAAMAWIGKGRAIAVGGTGHYPRRELPWCPKVEGEDAASEAQRCQSQTEEDYLARDLAGEEPNAAGRARVWLYANGRWGELPDEELPGTADGDPMSGLTTVDCTPRPLSDRELCWAGGMRQLWRFQDGSFTESFTPATVVDQQSGAIDGESLRFRVRSLRFFQGDAVPNGAADALAVTSGCCAETEAANSPRLLTFDGERWESQLLFDDHIGVPFEPRPETRQTPVRTRQSLPDSYYSLALRAPVLHSTNANATVVATTGAPPTGGAEPVSRLIAFVAPGESGGNDPLVRGDIDPCGSGPPPNSSDQSGDICKELRDPILSDLRLHAADGDSAGAADPASLSGTRTNPTADGLADWAVGELNSTKEGVAFASFTHGIFAPEPLTCSDTLIIDLVNTRLPDTSCSNRDPAEIQADTRSQSLYSLHTYTLNALAFTPEEDTAFAVGDKGGIAQLGGDAEAATESSEPEPDRTGPRTPATLPDDSAYTAQPQPAGASGPVPALADQPMLELEEPRLIPAGSPDPTRPGVKARPQDVSAVVMSRDGAEGWAIGPGASRDAPGTLYHFDGTRWRRCEMDGVPGLLPPDRACASLASLQRNRTPNNIAAPTELVAAARVPLERDSDPSNDDEFEVVAVGFPYKLSDNRERDVVLRYRDGRWSIDEQAMREIAPAGGSTEAYGQAVAFTAPGDGWVMASRVGGVQLFHFDGARWIRCDSEPAACGGSNALPLPGTSDRQAFSITAAGSRVYYSGEDGDHGFIYSIDAEDEVPTWRAEFDPGEGDPNEGKLYSLSVVRGAEGYSGWATGSFGPEGAPLLRLEPGGEQWQKYDAGDAAGDYLRETKVEGEPKVMSFVDERGREGAVIAPPTVYLYEALHPVLSWSAGGAWRVAPTPFVSACCRGDSYDVDGAAAVARAMAPDGQGGYWLAARQINDAPGVFFYRYSDRAPVQVFEDAPHPIRERITGISPGPGGRLWVATDSNAVYRYDRALGWDRATVPGWDPGAVVTRPSAAGAIAVGEDGTGVVVGEGGRIADISPSGIRLNSSAGAKVACAAAPGVTPCGTGRDLHAAAVASDGSAMVGGEARSLLWRDGEGGSFQAVPKPSASLGSDFTGISLPSPTRAYVVTDGGQVFRGDGPGPAWSWTLEDVDEDDELVTRDGAGKGIGLRAIALDSGEHGYAVGDRGLLIQRTGDAERPWRRLDSGVLEDLSSVALPQSGGEGALIGGQLGLILTFRDGRFQVARTDEFTEPLTTAAKHNRNTAHIVGLAMLPGVAEDQVEAWAATQVAGNGNNSRDPVGPGALLHYTNAPSESLLEPSRRTRPLRDTAPEGDSELELFALGRSDCHLDTELGCTELQGTNLLNEVVTRKAIEEIGEGSVGHERSAALFTGDIGTGAGTARGSSPVTLANAFTGRSDSPAAVVAEPQLSHRRWVEFVAESFDAAGLPLYGALGALDLPGEACTGTGCEHAPTGSSLPWREAMAGMPAPWGSGPPDRRGEIAFAPVEDSELTKATNPELEDPTGELPRGGARTHYALDITDTQGTEDSGDDDVLARLVVLDSSSRASITASDANQNPTEEQLAWLQEALCKRGSASDTAQRPCTREPDERAIVLTNTPTYSYGPGALTDTDTVDGTQFEQILFTEGVDAVISGRLGWNGLYYARAPGEHVPEAGGSHPDPSTPPDPLPGQPQPIPFLVASGGGGTFGPDGTQSGSASQGYWHGYSVLHLDPETGTVRVEQRPVFDWLAIRPAPGQRATHLLRAGGKQLVLEGFGREVLGMETSIRYDEINSHAITHRYELLQANPDSPWQPMKDAGSADDATEPPAAMGKRVGESDPCGPYMCLDPSVGRIDPVTGAVKTGSGNYPRTYAIAQLSVGEQSATYPLVFEPRASYRSPAPPPPAPVAVPAPPSPPAPAQPTTPSVNLPAAPVLPVLTAQALAPPPVPPAPPTFASEAPLDLNISPAALDVTPPTAVSQPPTPPVNPAPPGGARKEARQRQAAAQKSGADADQEQGSNETGDLAQGPEAPTGSAMTRHDFTAIAHREQPSAWARDALLGGGLGIAALLLALGVSTARPTPRRREPELPAPALARARTERRR